MYCVAIRKKQFVYEMLARHSPRETDKNQVLAGRKIVQNSRLLYIVCNTAWVQNGKFSVENLKSIFPAPATIA